MPHGLAAPCDGRLIYTQAMYSTFRPIGGIMSNPSQLPVGFALLVPRATHFIDVFRFVFGSSSPHHGGLRIPVMRISLSGDDDVC